MIRVSARTDGFRRAGMAHTKAPKDYPDGYFTEDQMKALEGDSRITVQILHGDPEIAPAAPADSTPGQSGPSFDEIDRARLFHEIEAAQQEREEALAAGEKSLAEREELLNADLSVLDDREKAADEREAAILIRENGVAAKETLMGVEDFRAALGKAAVRGAVENGNPDFLTANGAPKTEALEIRSGLENISAKERDAWFKELYLDGPPGKAG